VRFSNPYGYYELNPLPGCNQIVVSNHVCIYPEFRGQGLGHAQAEERIHNASTLGFDFMLCTVKADNAPQLAVMSKFEWEQLGSFDNTESGNTVKIFGHDLKKSREVGLI
jgi:L-amino acid N-acyltransferase YncA